MSKRGHGKRYSPNDMRSMVFNPSSTHYKAARDNRANQLNPLHPMPHDGGGGSPLVPGGSFERAGPGNPLGMLTRTLRRSGGSTCNLLAPDYTVAYGILPGRTGTQEGEPDARRFWLVGCRKVRSDESYAVALDTAIARYPAVTWRPVEWLYPPAPPSVLEDVFAEARTCPAPMPPFGRGLGHDQRYWAMKLRAEADLDGAAVHLTSVTPFPTPFSTIGLTRDGCMPMEAFEDRDALDDLIGG